MKILTKVALVSAMAISANAMALQAMDDESLSAATGKDGITIRLSSGISFDQLAIHDKGGLAAISGDTGAIVLGKVSATEAADGVGGGTAFSLANNGLDIVIDADGNGGAPVLNVGMDFGDTTINVGSIWVAESDFGSGTPAVSASAAALTEATSAINVGTVTLKGLEVNLQLGNQAQGALIKLDSSITDGLQLSSLDIISHALTGVAGTGQIQRTAAIPAGTNPVTPAVPATYYTSSKIGLSNILVTTNGSSDLDLNLLIDPTTNGLLINGLTALDVGVGATDLGNGTSIGGLSIKNLSVGNIEIKGH